jgi:ABC-type transport system involved in cytochrome c biogenesis permease subunit
MVENGRHSLLRFLGAAALVNGVLILALSWFIFEPLLKASASKDAAETKITVPDLDYAGWHALPVQEGGRTKPLESACEETVRNITGRARFEGKDPVAIVLMWRFLRGTSNVESFGDWETYHFILCPDRELREAIYRSLADPGTALTEEQLHGKYVSPQELRQSSAFRQLLAEAEQIRRDDKERASHLMTPAQRKAEEVAGRLMLFDSVSQNHPPQWGQAAETHPHPDPFHFVALDKVPGAGWFSLGELETARDEQDSLTYGQGAAAVTSGTMPDAGTLLAATLSTRPEPESWRNMMKERLSKVPQLYINPERQKALAAFQAAIKSGRGPEIIDDLAKTLKARAEQRLHSFLAEQGGATTIDLESLIHSQVLQGLDNSELSSLADWLHQQGSRSIKTAGLVQKLREINFSRIDNLTANLRTRLPAGGAAYQPDDPRFRMLHLDYLENLYPDLYPDSAAWQIFPRADVDQVLTTYRDATKAYRVADKDGFSRASNDFFRVLETIGTKAGPYPGIDTVSARVGMLTSGSIIGSPSRQLLDLEMEFDRVQPFHWAWIMMLVAAVAFIATLAVNSRVCYGLGWLAFLTALGYQLFGFFVRMVLSGRPPVTNIYETVIWVGFMSSIFGLVLELIYRRTVIVLAASLVSALGLVLADQLPLALDPKINPLVPVLRSNYWLTIHVLTIVSSYAAGSLAWGLGNVALALLAFGTVRRDIVKTLSQFTYRAIQIAVLLLAAGTFLGGWWAAESWGRFWGWDPKEVWALIALVCYIIPLHARYIGWVKDFGLAVAAVVCYAAIVMSWYGVNFVLAAGLHSYGFGGGGPWWIFWAGLLNIEWVLIASMRYLHRSSPSFAAEPMEEPGSV